MTPTLVSGVFSLPGPLSVRLEPFGLWRGRVRGTMLPFVKMWVAVGGTVAKESVAERRKIHVDLPAELHQKLRIKAALDGVSIQALVTRLVADAVGGIALPATRKQATRSR